MRNNELAEISIKLGRIIITRDADFTRLKKTLLSKMKVMYVKVTGDPSRMAELILDNMKVSASIFQRM